MSHENAIDQAIRHRLDRATAAHGPKACAKCMSLKALRRKRKVSNRPCLFDLRGRCQESFKESNLNAFEYIL